jgi:hypothetical protein
MSHDKEKIVDKNAPKFGPPAGWPEFAQWAIVYFGQFLENCKSSPNFLANFAKVEMMTKYGLGYILGNFFKTSPGHPVRVPDRVNYLLCQCDQSWPLEFD